MNYIPLLLLILRVQLANTIIAAQETVLGTNFVNVAIATAKTMKLSWFLSIKYDWYTLH